MNEREANIVSEKLRVDADDVEALAEEKAAIMSDRLDKMLASVERQLSYLEQYVDSTRSCINKEIATLRSHANGEVTRSRSIAKRIRGHVNNANMVLERAVKSKDKEIEKLKKELEMVRGLPKNPEQDFDSPETDPRAATIAILDSIIFAIGNWSTDGDTAPDFELACQSVLFPTIYERVMNGESDYYIEEVPVSAMEVVKRGREYVKMLRATCEGSLVAPAVWESHAGMVQEWWVGDALPLLYGARSDEWDDDKPLSLIEVLEWRDQPASRALHFPLIFDGMELVEKSRDQIRETTNLPEFNRNTLQTRLDP